MRKRLERVASNPWVVLAGLISLGHWAGAILVQLGPVIVAVIVAEAASATGWPYPVLLAISSAPAAWLVIRIMEGWMRAQGQASPPRVTTHERTVGHVSANVSEPHVRWFKRQVGTFTRWLAGRRDEFVRTEARRIAQERVASERPQRARNDTHRHVPRDWRDTTDHGETIGSRWVITILDDEWIEAPGGLVLATHISLANITDCDLPTPRFTIDSGARDADLSRDDDCRSCEEGHPPLPPGIPARRTRDGWLIGAFKRRYVGGRPGYRLISDDIPGNWRGHTRMLVEPVRGDQPAADEVRAIETELGNALWWSGQLLDEAQGSASGSSRYQEWAQSTTTYLRDRVGSSYASEFDGGGERGSVLDRISRKRAVIERYVAEFRELARTPWGVAL